MKFSIVIPTYNRADFIPKTIKSLLSQSYDNFEIIVVDDGSTDNTKVVVANIQDARVQYYKKENAERGAARNFGAKKATGDYINFFDSDDLAYPNHLETAFQVTSKNKDIEIFHQGYDIKTPNGQLLRSPSPIKNINKDLIQGNVLSCNGVFIKKEIAQQNPFSEIRELSASEDYLLWLQLAAKYPILNEPTITSTIIEHDNRSVLSINKEALIKRKQKMLELALNDDAIKRCYSKKELKKLKLNTLSYIALHLILAKEKAEGLNYLKQALQTDLSYLFTKRFLASIKHLVL